MNRGYVKLWRKSLNAGWLQNHALWAFWSYCLLKASHKPIVAKVGFQEVPLEPGQFVFGIHKAAAELKISPWKIRASIDFLKKAENITIKTTNKYSIISIVNWHIYQSEDVEFPQASPQTNHKQTTTYKNEKNEKNTPGEISEKILALKSTYTPDLIDRLFQSLASTRKSGKISETIILAQLEKWSAHPQGQVESAMRIYLEKGYAAEGKGEKYLLGIIRNGKPQTKAALAAPDWY